MEAPRLLPGSEVAPDIGGARHGFVHGIFADQRIPEYIPKRFHHRPLLIVRMAVLCAELLNEDVVGELAIQWPANGQSLRWRLVRIPGIYVERVQRGLVPQPGGIAHVHRIGAATCLARKHDRIKIFRVAAQDVRARTVVTDSSGLLNAPKIIGA